MRFVGKMRNVVRYFQISKLSVLSIFLKQKPSYESITIFEVSVLIFDVKSSTVFFNLQKNCNYKNQYT